MGNELSKKDFITISIIITIGLLIRLLGIRFGTPDLLHTDETRIILDSMSMGQRLSLLPQDINYPLLYKYILLFCFGVYYVLGKIIGVFNNQIDFAYRFLADSSTILIIARAVTSLLGTVTILIGYVWGKNIAKSKVVGLISATFIALEWQLVLESQYALHQTLAALGTVLAFYGLSLIAKENTLKNFILGGLFFGISIASHHSTILLLPATLFLLISDLIKGDGKLKNKTKAWVIFCIIALLIGLIGNLNWIFQFSKSVNFFFQGSNAGKIAFSSAQYYSYNIFSIIEWFFVEFIKRNFIIGIVTIIGIFYSIKKHKKIDLVYLITLLTYFIFFHNWAFRWMHIIVTVIPISILFGARWLENLIKNLPIKRTTLTIIFVIGILPNIIQLVKLDILKNKVETRQIAKEWIENNIDTKDIVAIDWACNAVPLTSNLPIILRSNVAKEYYEKNTPESVKRGYEKSVSTSKIYNIVDIIDSKPYPVWPKEMNNNEIKKASEMPALVDLYSYFNFKSLQEIKNDDVKYLVITSYTYGMFLESTDPLKENLNNTYIKDNIIPFTNHKSEIERETQHELLYYVAKRGRDYFSEILKEENNTVKLIKEFKPDKEHLGPTVRIYKII